MSGMKAILRTNRKISNYLSLPRKERISTKHKIGINLCLETTSVFLTIILKTKCKCHKIIKIRIKLKEGQTKIMINKFRCRRQLKESIAKINSLC